MKFRVIATALFIFLGLLHFAWGQSQSKSAESPEDFKVKMMSFENLQPIRSYDVLRLLSTDLLCEKYEPDQQRDLTEFFPMRMVVTENEEVMVEYKEAVELEVFRFRQLPAGLLDLDFIDRFKRNRQTMPIFDKMKTNFELRFDLKTKTIFMRLVTDLPRRNLSVVLYECFEASIQ